MTQSTGALRIDYRNRQPPRTQRRLAAFLWMGTLAVVGLTAGVGGILPESRPASGDVTIAAVEAAPPSASPGTITMKPQSVAATLGFDTIEVVVGRNDTLDRIFRRLKLDLADLATIRQLPSVRQGLDLLRPGDEISVKHQNGELQSLTRQLNVTQTLEVRRATEGFAAQIIENPVERTIDRRRGIITSSLFEAADEAGISDQTALEVANIFGWDVDFVLDIREGDSFIVVYEQLWQDGEFVRDGDIIAAEFVNEGRVYRALRYTLPDGHAEYFTPDGRSLRKTFLRAPVEFSRISSRFNPRRRHPVLNTIRAHKGVDYAAPSGTPVRARATDEFIFAVPGWLRQCHRDRARWRHLDAVRPPVAIRQGRRTGTARPPGTSGGLRRAHRARERSAPALRVPRPRRASQSADREARRCAPDRR